MAIYTGTILVSLIVYIAVSNYAGRRVKKLDDYFVAGRRAPTVLIVGTLVATLLTTAMFLGETGFVHDGKAGPYLLWPPMGAMSYIFGALLFGRYLRCSRALTRGDEAQSIRWCRLTDSNRRPEVYKTPALPTELSRQFCLNF